MKLLRAKFHGVPVWLLIVALVVIAVIIIRRRKAATASASSSGGAGYGYGGDYTGGASYGDTGGSSYGSAAGSGGDYGALGGPYAGGGAYTAAAPAASAAAPGVSGFGAAAGPPTFQGAFLAGGQSGQVAAPTVLGRQAGGTGQPTDSATSPGSVYTPGVPITRSSTAAALAGGTPTAATRTVGTYSVRAGDSWASIAHQYGMTTTQLTKLNPHARRPVVPGEVLRVYTSHPPTRKNAAAAVGAGTSHPTTLANLRTAS